MSIYFNVNAQSLQETPIQFLSTSFNTFIQAREIRNTDSCKIFFNSYLRKNTGIFNDVYQTNSQLGTRYKNSTISLQFYSDIQGELISRNRLYAHYNNQIKVSKKLKAFAGISAGIVNKNLGNSTTNIEGSANVFDASAIVGVYSQKFLFLFSALQIPQKTIMPISYEVPLFRYYNMYGIYSWDLPQNFKNEAMISYKFANNIEKEFIIGDQVTWQNNYTFGTELSILNKINYFIEFEAFKTDNYKTNILISYETNHSLNKNIITTFSIFNVGLKIKIK